MDVVTMVIMVGLVNVMLAIALLLQSRFNRQFGGVRWWAAGQTLIAAGLILSAFRGVSLTGKIVVPVWQTTTIAGFALLYVGILRFFDRPARWKPLVGLLIALAAWSSYFTFITHLVPPRGTAVYVCAATLVFACAHAVGKWGPPFVGPSATFVRIVFTAVGATYVLLAVTQALRWNQPQAMLVENPIYTTAYVATACGTVLWVAGLIFMVNERLQGIVEAQADNMSRIFTTSPDCAIISRLADGVIVNVNEGFSRVTGYPRSEAVGRSSIDLGLWRTPREREQFIDALVASGECENLPVVVGRKDGTTLDCEVSASTLSLEGIPHVISITRDVTQQRELEARLLRDARTDALTGVANRRRFLEAAQQELPQKGMCVAIIDIDGLKRINDVWGHAAGDLALRHFAEVASRGTRVRDVLGRLGGDEFGLLMPDSAPSQAFRIIETIRLELLAAPVPGLESSDPLLVTISSGITAVDTPADTVQTAIARADAALYQAKAGGRNCTVLDS